MFLQHGEEKKSKLLSLISGGHPTIATGDQLTPLSTIIGTLKCLLVILSLYHYALGAVVSNL